MKTVAAFAAGAIAASLIQMPAVAQTMPKEEGQALNQCFALTTLEATERGVTPEHFALIVRGACLEEQDALEGKLEEYFRLSSGSRSRPDIVDEVTAMTMQKVRERHSRMRDKYVADYTMHYKPKTQAVYK